MQLGLESELILFIVIQFSPKNEILIIKQNMLTSK